MIRENIQKVRERIFLACSKVGRNSESITILAVTKGRAIAGIQEAIEAGISDIGENKVQEALKKYYELRGIKWHMVGHLQTNKVKKAVGIFNLIHSVDSFALAQEIDKQAAKIGKIQDILLEVKTSPEATKFGLRPEEVIGILRNITELKNIHLKGLMTIAPLLDNPEKTRPYFKALKDLFGKINNLQLRAYSLEFLSMGMTDDFEVAIEEGATMVRLGRAIFGS